LALRIAWRDMAASRGKFLFIALAIAVGVGSLAGVRGFGRAFRTLLLEEARSLMAADLSVRVFELPGPDQQKVLDELIAGGARHTRITETVSVVAASYDAAPVLVSLKAVDAAVYPFYGELKLAPPLRLAEALQPDGIAVSDDLLIRLNRKVGDTIKLGGADYRIAAVVEAEPDRMAGSLNVGPRILMSRQGLDASGLIKPGSRAAQRHLLMLNRARQDIAVVRARLREVFPDGLIADYRETHPLITRGLNRSERFLSLVSLIALIVGALGVAATMHAHLEQRMDSIAILKCLGARIEQILRIYLAETVIVGLAGGLLGSLVGMTVQAVFPLLIAKFFSVTPPLRFDAVAAGEAMTVGLLTALLVTWPVLLGIRRVRPAVILRRDYEEKGGAWSRRWRNPAPWLAGGAILAGIMGIAMWLAGGHWENRLRTGGYFAGALTVSLILLGLLSWLLLRSLKLLLRAPKRSLPSTLRHGIANIYRPGNQAQAVLVSLGVGVMFTLTIFLIQRGLLDQILASAPPNMPNVFLLNVTGREREALQSFLESRKELTVKPEIVATVAARLREIDGLPLDEAKLTGPLRRFRSARSVTWSKGQRPQTDVVDGQWWNGVKGNQVCVMEDTARQLGVKTGARLKWTVAGQQVEATTACIYKSEEVRMGGNMDFVFSPGSLDHLPLQYFALIRMRPADVPSFQRASFQRFPSVTVINGADVLEIIQQVVDQIALVVRFISFFAILAGVIILASSVAATRFRRMKEAAVLKTLGGTRRRVIAIFSVEFLVLGVTAGLFGAALATGFSNLLLTRFLEAKARVDVEANLAAVLLSAAIAMAAGWLASWRVMGRKPLEVLRGE
jgi:putative ABC transport system permease protein